MGGNGGGGIIMPADVSACPNNAAKAGGCWKANGNGGTTDGIVVESVDTEPWVNIGLRMRVSLLEFVSDTDIIVGWYCTVVLADPVSKDVVSTFKIEVDVPSEVDAIDWNADLKACSCCCVGVSISVIVGLEPDGFMLDKSCIAIG
jgi:hypothetical protein